MLLDRCSSKATPRIFFVTATPRTLDFKIPCKHHTVQKTAARNNSGERAMVRKIAIEEHCLCPGFDEYWAPTVVDLRAKGREDFHARLTDFGEMRLAAMQRAGVERCVLSLAGPGVQGEGHAGPALRKARAANDFLADEIAKRPDRYSGFAHLPMQDANAAAAELERAMRDLRFCGAMINGHTNGQYLD